MRHRRFLLKSLVVSISLAVFWLTAGGSPAGAAVTVGQIGAANVPCAGADFVQKSVSSGTSYRMPEAGTITSWSHSAASGGGQQIAMKVFRNVSDDVFQIVGHDGPHPITKPGLLNTFGTSIPVQAGDLLGFDAVSVDACYQTGTPAEAIRFRLNSLSDGDGALFPLSASGRLNISAILEPSNAVTLGAVTLNKRKGTATINLTLPNPGELTASGKGIKASSADGAAISKSVAAGPTTLLIKAKGAQRKTLNRSGKVTLGVAITYTPANGVPGIQSVKVKLIKR